MSRGQLERLLARTRLVMGLLLLTRPREGGRLWFGPGRAPEPASRWLGVRDLALALTLLASQHGAPTRRTVFAEAALVDLGDALIAAGARRQLAGGGWWLIAAGAGAMAVADAALALTEDR